MAFEKAEDKRRFHRIFFNANALLEGPDSLFRCNIVDLSLKGCLLNFAEPWTGSPEPLYKLTLNLTDEIGIVMDVSVTHVVGNQVGFKCEHIDIDSICSLRRLVELNLGDSELLERELAALSDLGTKADTS
ncbi:MAG: PilZ domain-containing protein [Methylomonas sp.]